MNEAIHIVAIGARTPVGLCAEATAAAVRAGISRLQAHPFLIDASGESLRCAIDGPLEPTLLGPERLLILARSACLEVITKLAGHPALSTLPLLLAVPEPRPGFLEPDALWLQEQLVSGLAEAKSVRVELCGKGHAGGFQALARGIEHLREQVADVCLVAGVDGYFHSKTLDWLDDHRRLAREGIRDGFSPGEGASALALATDTALRTYALSSLAKVRVLDTFSEDPDADPLGRALTRVFLHAAETLQSSELFHDVYCDLNGERARTDDYGFALLRTSSCFRDGSAYRIAAQCCGDLGAASAVLNCALAIRAWRRSYASGSLALIWGASWSGMRGAAVLENAMAEP